MIAGLAVSVVILSGGVLVLYMRRWNAAGLRERALLKTIFLLCPVTGIALGLLLWLAEQALAAHSASPGALLLLAFPFLVGLPAILISRRLTQIRREEETSHGH